MAKAKTAVVVKKSPTAAVAVNNDKSILSTILKIIIIFFVEWCIEKYFYMNIWFCFNPNFYCKKKGLTFVRPGDGEPYF